MLDIITLGDERLKKHSILVPEFDGGIHHLIEQMFESMHRFGGVGLAAVQIGNLFRIFITDTERNEPRVFINPELIETSVEQGVFEEGCLSVPGINTDVVRSIAIKVQAWNEKGRPFTLDADNLLGRVIQHEIDHLNGILFLDRIDPKKKARLIKQYQAQKPD
ncbi:Peptide deformylase 1 [subsurface metagenome]